MGYHRKLESASQKRQWLFYESLWKYQKFISRDHWIDIPGNHDFTMKELCGEGKDIVNYSATSWKRRFIVIPYTNSPTSCECLLGVDFTYSPRLYFICYFILDFPYWLNSYGYATTEDLIEISKELETKK